MTDAGGLTRTETVNIAVTNQNEAPTDITVAGGSVQENAAAGTVVATLGATDPDAGSTFTYTLSSDPSGKFEVVGNEVRVKAGATLDYETATSHQVNVTVTDAGGLTRTETVNIAVTNQNEAPTDITVAGGSVAENAAAGTVVATLGATDPDAGSTFTYTLSSDPSGKFEVVGNEVRVKTGATLDYETATSHQVNVTVTDAGGLTRTETVNIAVTNQNEAPTDITVAGGSVQENAAAGTVVATLGATDPDAGSTFTYTLSSDPSGKFEIVGDEIRLKAGASLDHEAAASHQVNVTVTDAGGLTRTETVNIAVTNQNEAPTDITVAGGSVAENAAAGTVVATLGATDPDAGSTFTYTLSSDPSGKFEIVGNEVRVKTGATLDYETATSHQVNVTVTDAGGLTRTETVNIAVTNQNEAPTDITVAGGSRAENAAAGTVVATLGATDPDAGSTFTYTLELRPLGQVRGRRQRGPGKDRRHPRLRDRHLASGQRHRHRCRRARPAPRRSTSPSPTRTRRPTDITVAGGSVARERRGRDRRRHARCHRPRCRLHLHLYAELRPVGQVRGRRQRGPGKDRARPSTTRPPPRTRSTSPSPTPAASTRTETVNIAVTNQNEAPTDITVAGGSVAENAAAGTVVATLGATDPDAGSTFTYTLSSDPSGKFEIVGNEVRVKTGATLDYETATSHQVNVTVTDAGGLTRTETRQHRRHQPERGPDRHHRRGRLRAGERRGRHGRRHAGRHRPGCRLDLHLYAELRSLGQVRGRRQRGPRQGRAPPSTTRPPPRTRSTSPSPTPAA